MGAVYRAWDERLRRPVAIKHILPDNADDPLQRERLRREAQAAAGLSHPSIVQVFDIFEEGENDWIVMELVEGQTLATLIEAGRLGLGEALVLSREIAEGLAEAHGKGIVHRDLKTENVMITRSFHAKILDFGLAKILVSGPQDGVLSGVTSVLGTSRSMSPEQAMGQEVDHRSDLFSLGTLIYEAVTGRPPFLGNSNFSTLAKVCSARHPPAHQVSSRVPIELSNLLDRLLEKNPGHRPQSAREVVVELRFLEKQRMADSSGPYSPWSDTIAFSLPEPWAIAPAGDGAAAAEAPAATVVEAPAARRETEAGPALEPPELSPAVDPSLTAEGPPFVPGPAAEAGETTRETTELAVFPRPGVAESRAVICLRALVSLKAGEPAREPALQRWLAEAQRRHRGELGELGVLAAESETGLVFLFERPVKAVQFALFCIGQAAEDGDGGAGEPGWAGLGLRAGVHVGEIFLSERGGDPRAAFQAGGAATRIACRLAELAAPESVLLTPESAALARGALLENPAELRFTVESPRYFDETGEMLALVSASGSLPKLRRSLAAASRG